MKKVLFNASVLVCIMGFQGSANALFGIQTPNINIQLPPPPQIPLLPSLQAPALPSAPAIPTISQVTAAVTHNVTELANIQSGGLINRERDKVNAEHQQDMSQLQAQDQQALEQQKIIYLEHLATKNAQDYHKFTQLENKLDSNMSAALTMGTIFQNIEDKNEDISVDLQMIAHLHENMKHLLLLDMHKMEKISDVLEDKKNSEHAVQLIKVNSLLQTIVDRARSYNMSTDHYIQLLVVNKTHASLDPLAEYKASIIDLQTKFSDISVSLDLIRAEVETDANSASLEHAGSVAELKAMGVNIPELVKE